MILLWKRVGIPSPVPRERNTLLILDYKFRELPPMAPNTAEATAIITFRIVSQTDFFMTRTPPFGTLNRLVTRSYMR